MIAAVILAAGESSRLGKPKQLLLYKNKTLINWAVEAARNAGCQPVIVVEGAVSLSEHIQDDATIIINNNNWQEGMSSSIATAMQYLKKNRIEVNAIVILVCDQPFVNADIVNKLFSMHKISGKSLVASAYGNTFGVPVLIGQKYFDQLYSLSGKQGAKKLLASNPHDFTTINFEGGTLDIDTIDDYKLLNKLEE